MEQPERGWLAYLSCPSCGDETCEQNDGEGLGMLGCHPNQPVNLAHADE